MARVTGLEPATSGVTGRHSNQLSYTRNYSGERIRRSRVGLRLSIFEVKPRVCYSEKNLQRIFCGNEMLYTVPDRFFEILSGSDAA